MDPNIQSPQGESDAVKKLEQDLQDLTRQAVAAQSRPAPVVPPTAQNPQVPATPPAIPTVPPATPIETKVPVPESPKKGSPLMIIAIVLALVAVLAVVAYVFGAKFLTSSPKQTACTLEAKICPDGSNVGRTGPNCEFAECPTSTPDVTANWKTVISDQFSFSLRYPQDWVYYSDADNDSLKLPYVRNFSARNETLAKADGCAIHFGFGGSSGPSEEIQNESVTLGGLPYNQRTWLIENNPVFGSYIYEGVSPASKKFELLLVWIAQDDPISCQNEIEQILSTFKFLPTMSTSDLPADLVAVVKQDAVNQSNPKVTVDKVVIGDSKVVGNYAMVAFSYSDGGGAIDWLSKVDGVWKVATSGQEPPSCSTLKNYNFPVDFDCNP